MKKVEKITEGSNHSAINIGSISDLKSYSLIHPKLNTEIKGKLFVNALTGATGTEISFTTLPPKSDIGYFHIHNKDEETYIVIKGSGSYQVDDDCFPIKEGSVIRVAPEGARSICNTSADEDLVYICVQAKANSLEEHTADDGRRVEHTPKWEL
nr:cupin domain-containing protein [uncultured Carboxylicivirga sp.]